MNDVPRNNSFDSILSRGVAATRGRSQPKSSLREAFEILTKDSLWPKENAEIWALMQTLVRKVDEESAPRLPQAHLTPEQLRKLGR